MTRKYALALIPALLIAALCIAVLAFSTPGAGTSRDEVGSAPAAVGTGRPDTSGGPAPKSTEGKGASEEAAEKASTEKASAEKQEAGQEGGSADQTAGAKAGAPAKTARASEKAAPGSRPERAAGGEGKDKTAGAKKFPNEAPARDPGDKDPHMTGLKLPTREEIERERRTTVGIKRIRLNRIALERINAGRRKKGLPPLKAGAVEVVPLGKEILGTKPGEDPGPGAAPQSDPVGLPDSADNSTLKYFPPIRSQSPLGSCAQFSTMYYTFTHMTALVRDWDAKNGGDDYRFSPKWTYNMVNGGSNGGSTMTSGLSMAQKHGCATWAEFPYDSNYRAWCLDSTVWRSAITRRADERGYVYNVDTAAGLDDLKQMLVNGYIVNYATYVNSWQWKTIGDDPATSEDDAFAGKYCCYWVSGTGEGHGMTVVGYNDHVWVDINGDGDVDSGEKGALRICNSWGTNWREGGFSWVAYDALKAASAVDGGPSANRGECFWGRKVYWVTARASYAPKMVARFTVNHLKRNQLRVHLGISDTGTTTPATNWYPQYALSFAGGAYAFDGSTTACDGTFYFDFTDILPPSGQNKRWYVGIYDNAKQDEAAISSFKLYKVTDGGDVEAGTAGNVPKTADNGEQQYVWVDHTYEEDDNDPPTISDIADQSTNEDVAKGPVSFTVGDAETSAGDLVLTKASSNPALVPTVNIAFGGSGADRTVTVTPAPDEHGTATITVTVTDGGGLSASDSFVLTVNPVNDPPTVSNVADASTDEDIPEGPIALTIGDAETAAGDLVLTKGSSNTTLVPLTGIVFGGAGASRTVTVTPATNQSGTATITITVEDEGGLQASDSFVLTVNPVNDPPTISDIADAATDEDTPKGPIAFTIGDVETVAGGLVLSKASSNTTLVPLANIILGGAGASRTVTVIPELNGHGSATITITVTDGGGLSASDSFVLTVNSENDLPVISTFNPATPFSMEADASQAFEVSAHDDDGDLLFYAWEIDGVPTGNVTFDMTYSPTEVDVGPHAIKVTVSDGNGGTDSHTWNVTVTTSVPAIGRGPAALSPSCTQGQDAAAQTFEVWNAGGGTLNYTISDDAAWLSCAPAAGGSAGEHDEIIVTCDTDGLAAGTHNATITIAAAGAANGPQTVSVALTVNALPSIGCSTGSLAPSCTQGANAAGQSFTVRNSGGGTIDWSVSDNAGWLSCSPSSGSSTGESDTVEVTYSTSGLAAGTYNATVTVTAPGATNTPQTIAVTLTVNSPQSGGGGGGGGGSCALAAGSDPLGWALPYLALAGGWLFSRLRRRRRG